MAASSARPAALVMPALALLLLLCVGPGGVSGNKLKLMLQKGEASIRGSGPISPVLQMTAQRLGAGQHFPEHACRSGAFSAAESAMERRPGKPWESEGHPHQEAVEAFMVTLQPDLRTRCSAGLAGRPAQTLAPALSPLAP
ncbi:augurin isoform X3 [Tursiops truncatus]|uniref:augurin isoform X3 n=1 Tax=Tursiops truncatus TaxID=9739 RepID=UPI003CCF8981